MEASLDNELDRGLAARLDRGSDRDPMISLVEIRLLDLPLVAPFAASHGTTWSRSVVVIRLETENETRAAGWGECSALPAATYTAESTAGCYRLLVDRIGPELVGGRWSAAGLGPLRVRYPDRPMTLSAVEMALLDAELRARGEPLARRLGATRTEVPAGVSLGLDRLDAVTATARLMVADGYRRLKVKIEPGHDREVVEALASDPDVGGAGVEIQVDANGAYGAGDVDLLVGLVAVGADALEQPLAPAEVEASARLVERLAELGARSGSGSGTVSGHRFGHRRVRSGPVPVVADEAVASAADAAALADRGALTGVSIKPARLGGLLAAVEVHDLCRDRGLAATAGGMLETGLGRHALAALAALPGFDLTGDLSPASRWLAADPWPDVTLSDGRIAVPTGPGVAPNPDPELLDRYTVERTTLTPDR